MASPHKRKRDAYASPSSSSVSPASTHHPSTSTPRRPFAPIFEDSLPSPQPMNPSGSMSSDTRQQLELSLSELRTSAARIKSLLQTLPPTSRSALTEVAAPPQNSSLTSSHSGGEEVVKEVTCSKCHQLQEKVQELEQERVRHEKERQAWKEFKSWWLASLAQKDKRHRKKHKSKAAAASCTAASSSTEGAIEGGSRVEEERRSAVVKKLDATTRGVWVRAGIIPPDNAVGGEAERAQGEEKASAGPRRVDQGEQGDMGESAGQQSEVTLPLHAHPPSNAAVATASTPTTTAPTAAAPSASAQPHTRNDKLSPLIRTIIPRPTTLPRAQPVPPTTNTTRDEVGYVDSTPIRNPLQRRAMLAHDCPDCSLFYSHLNTNGEGLGNRERTACSRHRTTFQRATTPDGYWNIGFPTTQEVEEINASAKAKRVGGRREEGGSGRRR